MADGHGYFPNCSMINGKLVTPYKFRSRGNVYCLSTYIITVVMGIEVWRTDADCAMIMGWIPSDAISYAFNCSNNECVYQDKARHTELTNQAQDVVAERQRAQFNVEEEKRVEQEKRTADAVAAGQRVMPPQHHGKGPTPPEPRMRAEEFAKEFSKPRWNEDDFEEGAYDKSAKEKSFWGDGDQCYRIWKMGPHQRKVEQG